MCTSWLMQIVQDTDLRGMGEAVQQAWRDRPHTVSIPAERVRPISATVRGALAHTARPLLDSVDETAAIDAIRALRGRRDTKKRVIPAGMATAQWTQLSP
jgi:hypothetical protein